MDKSKIVPCQASNDMLVEEISVLDRPAFEGYAAFCEWVKLQDVEDLGFEDWPWRSARAYPMSSTILKGWTTQRSPLGAHAFFGTGEDQVILPLPLKHVSLVDHMPLLWREYYDVHILACPRRAKLLDRLLDEMVKIHQPSFPSSVWGDDEEPLKKQVKDLIQILAYLQGHGPYERYSDFVLSLNAAYIAVYYKDPFIKTQSGLSAPRQRVDMKRLISENQLREFSVKQMMRVKREVIQRAVAAGKIEAAKLCTPHRQRDKVRTVVRDKLRKLKRANIESQGLGRILKAPLKAVILPFKAIKNLLEMPGNVNSACSGLVDVTDQLSKDMSLKGMVDKTTDAATSAGDVFGMIRSSLDKVKEILESSVTKSLLNIILAAFVYYLYCRFESPLLRSFLVGALLGLVGSTVNNIAVKFFKVDSETGSSIDVQSGIDSGIIAKLIGSILIGTIFIKRKPKGLTSLFNHIVVTMAAVPRAMKGIEGFVDGVISMTEAGVNAIRSWFKLPHVRFANKFSSMIGDLAERVAIFAHQELTGTTGLTASQRYNKLMSFHSEVTTFLQIYSTNKEVRIELEALRIKILRLAQPLRHVVGVGAGYRIQPVSLVLAGLPGIGKTAAVQAIALTLMKLAGDLPPDSDLKTAEQAVFTKPANSPYMDGYQEQWCYLMDDFLQVKPVAGQDSNGITDLMTLYGGFTTMLNMAECDKKGMFPFTSKLILMTTNCTDLKQVGVSGIILSEEAFKRRIDHHICLSVLPEFRKPGTTELDYNAFLAAGGGDPTDLDVYPWHVWEYHEVSFNGYEPGDFQPGTGRPLKELLIKVAEHVKANKTAYNRNEELFAKICKAPITPSWIHPQSGLWHHESDDDEVCLGSVIPGAETVAAAAEIHVARYLEDGSEDGSEMNFSMPLPDDLEPPTLDMFFRDNEISLQGQYKVQRVIPDEAKDWLDSFKSRVRSALNVNHNNYHKLALQGLILGVAAKLVIPLIAGMFQTIYKWIKKLLYGDRKIEEQSNAPKPRTVRFAQQQSGGTIPALWRLIYDNTFKTAVDLGDQGYGVMGQILFLKESFAVMPYHFITDLQKNLSEGKIKPRTLITMRGCQQQSSGLLPIDITVDAFLSYPRKVYSDRDLAFIDFQNSIKPRRNIMDKILRKSEIDDIGGSAVRLDTARMDKDGVFIEYNDRETFISPSVEVGRSATKIGPTIHQKWLRYQAPTVKGDCGATLCLTDHSPYSCRLVAGVHVGYDPTWGQAYATPLDVETCEEAARALSVFSQPEQVVAQCGWEDFGIVATPITEMPFNDGDKEGFGSFEPLLEVSPGLAMPVKSKLQPTPMGETEFFKEEIASFYDGAEPDSLEVMKLGFHTVDGVGVWPMAEAMRPFSGKVRIINQKKFKMAIGIAMQPFNRATQHHMRRTLTYREAVCGLPAIGLKGITRQTSVGFPWVVKTKSKDKTYFFGSNQEYDLETLEAQELERQVEQLQRLLEAGQRPLFVCRDFLKDEVRKRGKSARLIAGTDIRYYILCRMYFGAYVAALMTHHKDSGICIGMNQYSEWGWLHEHMTRPGNKMWDGDFAGFDQSQQPSMLWPFLEQINDWYSKNGGGADNEIRRILFYDLVFSRHLTTVKGVATVIIEWAKSLPSGHFLTAVINSGLSLSFLVSAFIHYTGLIDFWKHASAAVLGDDNLCSVSDELIHLFNQVTVASYLLDHFGMTYTAGRKGEALKEYMGIEDVIFLQRRFAWKNDCCVCPIRPESFLHNLYYTKKGSESYKREVIINSIEDAFQELAMHDEDQWKKVAPKLEEALAMYGAVPRAITGDSSAYFELVRQRVPEWL